MIGEIQSPAVEHGPSSPDSNAEIDRDAIFEILSNQRRRYILLYLIHHIEGDTADLREIVDQVAAWENDTTIDELQSTNRKRVYTAVRQSHLPKIDTVGLIEYDQQRGKVSRTEATAEIKPYLEYIPREQSSWGIYYLGVSIACLVAVGGLYLELPVIGNLSALTLTSMIVIVIGLLSVVHIYHTQLQDPTVDDIPVEQA